MLKFVTASLIALGLLYIGGVTPQGTVEWLQQSATVPAMSDEGDWG